LNTKFSCEGFVGNNEGEIRDHLFFCSAGINIASVLADGSIGACPNIDPSFIQGNIYEDNFTDVWENRFEIMRKRSWTKTGQCRECHLWKYCQGNGLHWWDDKKENVIRCHCFFS
jgi:radical SAM protein with 4Fe4S-binding SPASM domain